MSSPPPTAYHFVPERCGVILEARSNVGRIDFAAATLTGWVEASFAGDRLDLDRPVAAVLEIGLADLVSGNALYDAELQRRLDARLHPTARIELAEVTALDGDRYAVGGPVTIHGVTRELHGAVTVRRPSPGTVVVTGEQVIDIRDFALETPGMLMLRIFPDVRVLLHLEGERDR
jgi:polyisoprenoid-binding protein YceI